MDLKSKYLEMYYTVMCISYVASLNYHDWNLMEIRSVLFFSTKLDLLSLFIRIRVKAYFHLEDSLVNTAKWLINLIVYVYPSLTVENKNVSPEIVWLLKTVTAWKISVFGVYLVLIFLHWDWIRRETRGFLMFSGDIERDQWLDMG